MAIDIRTSIPAALVALGCLVVVTVRAATAEERADLAGGIATNEHQWAVETTRNFPEDLWSQRDDFHGREYRYVVDLARSRGVRIEDVLRAVDEDLHLRKATGPDAPDDRHARAIPCKPRPFYD